MRDVEEGGERPVLSDLLRGDHAMILERAIVRRHAVPDDDAQITDARQLEDEVGVDVLEEDHRVSARTDTIVKTKYPNGRENATEIVVSRVMLLSVGMNRALRSYLVVMLLAGCGGARLPAPGAPTPVPESDSGAESGAASSADERPFVEPELVPEDESTYFEPPDDEPEPLPVHDAAPSAERLRAELRTYASYDYELAALLQSIEAAPAEAEADEARARAMLDLFVRHSVPFVWEYVFMGSRAPETLRLARSLATARPITDDRSRRALGRVLATYVGPLTREVARLEAEPTEEDPEMQAGQQAERETVAAMLALVRDSLLPLLQQPDAPTPEFVVDVALAFAEVASRVDIDGSDTGDRARRECARILMVFARGEIDAEDLPPLRAAQPARR